MFPRSYHPHRGLQQTKAVERHVRRYSLVAWPQPSSHASCSGSSRPLPRPAASQPDTCVAPHRVAPLLLTTGSAQRGAVTVRRLSSTPAPLARGAARAPGSSRPLTWLTRRLHAWPSAAAVRGAATSRSRQTSATGSAPATWRRSGGKRASAAASSPAGLTAR